MTRVVASSLIVVLAVAACQGGSGVGTTATPPNTSVAPSTTTTPPSSTTTSTPGPQATPPDLSGLEGLSPEARQQLEELIVTAEELRELVFIAPPTITVVSDEELEARVRQSIEEDIEDFPADEGLYKLLGLLDPQADLLTMLLDLYGEQVAGFYDGDTREIVVPSHEGGLSVLQRGTLVHELVHALTDQHFEFDGIFDEMIDEERLDQASAYQALIEGDAVLAEVLWVRGLTQRELGEFVAESLEADTTALEGVPQFIQDSLLFPYDAGLAFTETLYGSGGWSAVNEAYSQFPGLPPSTEQVITPEDYRRDLPVEVDITPVALEGYELERTSTWGELGFRVMIDQVLGESAGDPAADGWGGDAYHQWFDGENAALLLVFRADTEADLEELEGALIAYEESAVAEEAYGLVAVRDGSLFFILADEVEAGEQITQTLGFPLPLP
jgi:hypothetical protein